MTERWLARAHAAATAIQKGARLFLARRTLARRFRLAELLQALWQGILARRWCEGMRRLNCALLRPTAGDYPDLRTRIPRAVTSRVPFGRTLGFGRVCGIRCFSARSARIPTTLLLCLSSVPVVAVGHYFFRRKCSKRGRSLLHFPRVALLFYIGSPTASPWT